MNRVLLKLSFALALFASATGVVNAQSQLQPDLNRRASTAAFYYHAEEGDLTLLVNVWGSVRFPGRYEIREGTTLAELFSLAGGPMLSPRSENDTPIFEVSLSRLTGTTRQLSFDETSEDMREVLSEMVLQEGDVLMVETYIDEGFRWTDVFPLLSALATVALIIERLASP